MMYRIASPSESVARLCVDALLRHGGRFRIPTASHVDDGSAAPPQEQLKTFHLPPGFEIQLVAAEPEIRKPINLAFDVRPAGSYVTGSVEYPYAAPTKESRTRYRHAVRHRRPTAARRKLQTVVDGLNIPIGICAVDRRPARLQHSRTAVAAATPMATACSKQKRRS